MSSGTAAAPRPRSLSNGWIAASLTLAVISGLAITSHPILALAAVAIPLLFLFVVVRPEWILILFLTAGIYKQDPRITGAIPLDITVVMGAMLILAVACHTARRGVRLPVQGLLLVPLVLMLLRGLMGGSNDYGAEKALRFLTLTILALVGAAVLLADRARLERFLFAVVVLGCMLCVDAIHQPQTTTEGRLTAHGSNPISLARLGSFTLAYGWIRFQMERNLHARLIAITILGLGCWCVIAAGSRGPVLSTIASMSLISFVTMRHHGRSPVSVTVIALVAGMAALVVSLAAIPQLPLHRFALLFSDDKGTSILLRAMLMATAFNLTLAHPLGLGVGGFARHAVLDLKYPHNIFLEIGSELGWVPLLCFMILMALSIKALYDILAREYTWSALFLSVIVLAASMNAMVTGDLNDNRMLFALLLLPFAYRRAQPTDPRPAHRVHPAAFAPAVSGRG